MATLTWSLLPVLFVLGAGPVFIVRLLVCLYPKDDPRRRELVAEMEHVAGLTKALERWYWLANTFAVAICEGLPARRAARRAARVRKDAQGLIGPISLHIVEGGEAKWVYSSDPDHKFHVRSEGGTVPALLLPSADQEILVRQADGTERVATVRDAVWLARTQFGPRRLGRTARHRSNGRP
jgi:hypothetical protein